MAVFLGFYQSLLERERMHHFKRFFLLGALVASLVIPALVFTEYVEAAAPSYAPPQTNSYASQEMPLAGEPVTDKDVINWSLLLWTIYSLGLILFGLRFVKHLYQILQRIRKNPKLKLKAITQVLLREKMPPHTFFSYIFLNKEALEKNTIPKEVLIHEETHAKQVHSLDVMFIELLQVILWFNPLLILFKKNIKLNHEFLADGAVLKDNVPTKSYQNTLLSFLSTASEKKYQSVEMANAINYSSIKKRIKVMKKRTSKKSILVRVFLLLPLLVLLISGFCERKTIHTYQNQLSINGIWLEKVMEQYVFSIASDGKKLKFYSGKSEIPIVNINGLYYVQYPTTMSPLTFNEKRTVLKFQGKEYVRFEDSNRKKYEGQWENNDASIKLNIENYNSAFICHLTTNGQTNKFYPTGASSKGFGFSYGNEFWMFELKDGVLVDSRGNIFKRSSNPLSPSTRRNPLSTNGLTKAELVEYEDLSIKYSRGSRLLFSEMQRMLQLQNRMSKEQKRNHKIAFKPLAKSQQTSASREQMREYNALARKYNEMPRDNMHILTKEVERMKYIHSIMSEKQKADAEPFPDFPEPPAPPKAPKVISDRQYASNQIDSIIKTQDPSDEPIRNNASGSFYLPSPPLPPAPVSPLDHVIEMAKKGATFYFEGKKISSDKAIELLKKNKNLNIETTNSKSKKPKVKISKAPISIGKIKDQPSLETGNIKVNGKELFYTKKGGITTYHDNNGERVDAQGQKLTTLPKRKPTYYFNGEQISSARAHELLRNNTSIQVGTEDIIEEEYAIVLIDLNAYTAQDYNKNTNHNALIDLTEMISKGASFYYNDEPITTEKALWLTQNDEIERVQTVGSKNGRPKVYFWKKV